MTALRQEISPDDGKEHQASKRSNGRRSGEHLNHFRHPRIPATFKVIRHVRPKFACSACDRVVEAPAPSRPIAYGLAAPNLLAHVLVSKFGDHQPLYRQSEIFAREGIDLDRSTLAGWVGAASGLVAPLVDEIRKHVLAGSKLHADDTPVLCLPQATFKMAVVHAGPTAGKLSSLTDYRRTKRAPSRLQLASCAERAIVIIVAGWEEARRRGTTATASFNVKGLSAAWS
jgi:transposase